VGVAVDVTVGVGVTVVFCTADADDVVARIAGGVERRGFSAWCVPFENFVVSITHCMPSTSRCRY